MSGTSYFMDGLAPFRRYLSQSVLPQNKVIRNEDVGDDGGGGGDDVAYDGVSDWGIDSNDFRSMSSPTLVNDYAHGQVDIHGDTPRLEEDVNFWGMSPAKVRHVQIQDVRSGPVRHWSASELCKELKRRNEDLELQFEDFIEDYRYLLVTSELLDEALMVSKFSKKKKSAASFHSPNGKQVFYTKHGEVVRYDSKYSISPHFNELTVLDSAIQLNRLKSRSAQLHSPQDVKTTLIRSLSSTHLYLRSKSIITDLWHVSTLSKLKAIIQGFQKFDTLVAKLITKFKELSIYTDLVPHTKHSDDMDPNIVFAMVNSVLTLSLQRCTTSSKELLASVNGLELQNYCDIYNVQTTDLVSVFDPETPSFTIDFIVNKLYKLRSLRRFFICSLLAFDFGSERGEALINVEFMRQLTSLFKIDSNVKLTISSRWGVLLKTLDDQNSLIVMLTSSMKDFIQQHDISLSSLPMDLRGLDSSTKLDPTLELSKHIKDLQLKLLAVDRNAASEVQLESYRKLQITIDSIVQQYHKDLNKLENSSNRRPFHLTKQRVTSTTRKRFSLPLQHVQSSPSQQGNPSKSASSSPKHYKRMSSGLGLPLLTVTESTESSSFYQDDYVKNFLSTNDSVVISSNTDDTTFETMDDQMLKEQLEKNFSMMTSTNSVSVEENGEELHVKDGEMSKNDVKVDSEVAHSLFEEMKTALSKREDQKF